jgi:tetratricopeptide (TPR) repeat protein
MGLWKAKQWRAVKRLPGDGEAWFAIGVAAVEAGRLDEAIYALVHSADLAPDDGERARLAAEQLLRAGCPGEAEKVCLRALELPGLEATTSAGLIRVLLDAGSDRAAREALDRALAITPDDPELRSLAAAACERLGELSAAIDHLENVLAGEPDHLELNRRLALLLGDTGERGRSITCWRRVTAQTGGDDLEGLMALGISLRAMASTTRRWRP